MDRVTQGNSSAAEESAASAQQLNSQSEELRSVVNQLRRLVQGAGSSVNLRQQPLATRTHPAKEARRTSAAPSPAPAEDDDFSDFNMKAA
jgi:hypothetical protein